MIDKNTSLVSSPNQENWVIASSSTNKLNQKIIFSSSNEWDFPDLQPTYIIPAGLVSFHDPRAKRGAIECRDSFVHFFLDDYFFESVWSRPQNLFRMCVVLAGALSPTFSVYSNAPRAMNIWNVYRNRWISRLLQEQGVEVVPVPIWSTPDSYDYCFAGLPKRSTIAITTVGTWRLENRKMFCEGFDRMIDELDPTHLCIYGEKKPLNFEEYGIPITYFPSEWKLRRDKMKV